jgi:hypothetical protein
MPLSGRRLAAVALLVLLVGIPAVYLAVRGGDGQGPGRGPDAGDPSPGDADGRDAGTAGTGRPGR